MLSFSSMFFCFAAIQFKSHNPWTARRFPPRIAPMPATQEFAEEAYRFPFLFTPCMVFLSNQEARFRMAVTDASNPVCLPVRPATLTTASMRTMYEFRLEWFHADDCTIRPSATTDNSRTRPCATRSVRRMSATLGCKLGRTICIFRTSL